MTIENIEHQCAAQPMLHFSGVRMGWSDQSACISSVSKPHEQRKIEKLLVKLAKIKPMSGKPGPIMSGHSVLRTAWAKGNCADWLGKGQQKGGRRQALSL